MQNDDMLTIPFGEDDKVRAGMIRNEGQGDRAFDLKAGTCLVEPGQMVDKLYLLLDGSIDLVRDMGTPSETRTSFTRNIMVTAGNHEWTPVLGGRYFFLKKASSLHYVAAVTSKVLAITPQLISKFYAARDCRKLVRELIRNSDMQTGIFTEELDKRFDTLHYPGFRKDDLEGLLREQPGTPADHKQAYIDYACDMIYRLMGDMIAIPDDGSTKITFEKPAVMR